MANNQQNTSWDLPDFATPPQAIELPDLFSSFEHRASPSPSRSTSRAQNHTSAATSTTYQPPPLAPPPRYPPPTFTVSEHGSALSQPSPSTQYTPQRSQLLRGQAGTLDSPRQWLDAEPPSPGASTLVDSPPAVHLQGLQSSGSGTPTSPFSTASTPRSSTGPHGATTAMTMRQAASTHTGNITDASAFISSASLANGSGQRFFNEPMSDDHSSSFVPIQLEPISNKKRSGEWQQHTGPYDAQGTSTLVTMYGDMTPARRMSGEQSYCAQHGRQDSCMGAPTPTSTHSPYSGHHSRSGGGGGRYTPSVTGSTTSARTLLPGIGRTTSPSPASTKSRSFLSQFLAVPWQRRPSSALFSQTSSTATLIPHHQNTSNSQVAETDHASPQDTVSSTGKVYMKRPKDKKFGAKGGGGAGKGSSTKGDGTRKALFSNERTFLHWIRFGILLGTLSMTLLNFGERRSLSYYVGTALLCIAMLSLGYAASTFHYRDRLLSHKLSAQMLQMQMRKQISSEPGALTAARIADVAKSRGGVVGGNNSTAGPATIINVESRGESSAIAALQARIDWLKHKAQDGKYYDRVGPTLLAGALIIAYGFNFYLSVVSPPKNLLTHATGTSFFGQI